MQRQRRWGDGRWGEAMVGWSVKVLKHECDNRGKAEASFSQLLGNRVRSAVFGGAGWLNWGFFFYLFFIQPLVRHRCFQMKAHTHREWKPWREIVLFIWSRSGGLGEEIRMGRGRNIHRSEWKKAAKQASCCFHLPQHVYVCEWW